MNETENDGVLEKLESIKYLLTVTLVLLGLQFLLFMWVVLHFTTLVIAP